MMDINWWQLILASVGLSLTIGGVFVRYIQGVNKVEALNIVTGAIKSFRDNEINPVIQKLSDDLQKVADLSSRLGQVELGVKNLNHKTSELAITVADNAKQSRNDLSGLGTRLSQETKNQTDLLVKLIEAKK